MVELVFWFSAILAVIFASFMLAQSSLFASSICLLAVLMQAATLFFLSGAPMLAFVQVLVYAGAVMVLIVVAVMASPGPAPASIWSRLSLPRPLVWAGLILPALEFALLLWAGAFPGGGSMGAALSTQNQIGPILFGPYALATEAVTLLMFLASLAVLDS
ncbi:MAG: NADH-quinone oxidoreductase subunit J [Elusimicrobia bacterium]|nr:NADH-quinone oxidoreductase subunit J [Elusimicrobiota bacterium]